MKKTDGIAYYVDENMCISVSFVARQAVAKQNKVRKFVTIQNKCCHFLPFACIVHLYVLIIYLSPNSTISPITYNVISYTTITPIMENNVELQLLYIYVLIHVNM